jgi:hypothetical protein
MRLQRISASVNGEKVKTGRASFRPHSLIPTPREIRFPDGTPKRYSGGRTYRIMLCGKTDRQVEFAAGFLRSRLAKAADVRWQVVQAGTRDIACARLTDILLCADGAAALSSLVGPDLARLEGLAAQQGYAIRSAAASPVVLYACSPTGLLYAAATLLQLVRAEGRDLLLDNVEVKDWPEFEYRGNNWLLANELYGWSYDRGDGRKAYEERIVRKLDLSVLYKINLITFDGFGWNPERFSGYGPLMRRLARAARLRGIKLEFGGYGSSYGMQAGYDGTIFRNRKRYPHGTVYACCGMPGIKHTETSRTMGTCLSNRALLKLKQEELVEFVRRVEPGMLYIHNVDAMGIKESTGVWRLRCPACRKKWPSDEVAARDGMAGAFALFYDALARAVNGVRNRKSGYDAARDCLLMMVSPAYTSLEEGDRKWRKECAYFALISRLCRERNIVFGLREQFCNFRDASPRYRQMRKAVDAAGNGHRIANIFFYGGDGFMSNYPFLATPVLNRYFQGAHIIMTGNGDGYQEPQQLLHAEYCWNPHGSAFHVEPLAATHAAWKRRYLDLCSTRASPRAIFGKGGFLDVACCGLYGPKAGKRVAEIYRMSGRHSLKGLFPAGFQSPDYDRPPVFLPLHNKLAPAGVFASAGIVWQKEFGADAVAKVRRLARAYREMIAMNRRAQKLARRAAGDCRDPDTADDLRWMAGTLSSGARLLEAGVRYLDLFVPAQRQVSRDRDGRARILRRIRSEENRLAALERELALRAPGPALDPKGGDLDAGCAAVAGLRSCLQTMRETLKTGRWPASGESVWW